MELTNLLTELSATQGVLFVVSTPGVVFELTSSSESSPTVHDGWVQVKGKDWHAHIDLGRVAGVQFVEQEDHGTVPSLYYVRFSDSEGETLFRTYFPNPYLNDEVQPSDFQPEKLAVFHEFRDSYIDQDGITYVQRAREEADRANQG